MTDEFVALLNSYQPADLHQIAEAVLNDRSAHVVGQQRCEPIAGLSMGLGTLALVRLQGNADTGSGLKPWSVVIKVIEIVDDVESIDRMVSPEREISAYRAGDFDGGESGMRAAHCYRIDQPSRSQVWLWIEDLSDWTGPSWNLKEYTRASEDVGLFTAYWAANSPPSKLDLPRHIGINRFTWANIARLADLDTDSELNRRIQSILPRSSYIASQKLSDAVAQASPVVGTGRNQLVHGDCHPRNIFLSPPEETNQETVAIDWAGIGLGPIGNDIGTLVGSGMSWGENEFQMLFRSERELFEAFFSGLGKGGWQGSRDFVRLSYLSNVCGYGMYFGAIAVILSEERSRRDFFLERSGECTAEDAFQKYVTRLELLETLADEVLTLSR